MNFMEAKINLASKTCSVGIVMKEYSGIAASPGIVIGEVFVYNQDFIIDKYQIGELQVEYELDRFYTALRKTKQEFESLKLKVIDEMGEDQAKFLDSHILITEDKSFIEKVIETIRKDKKNIEWVVYEVVDSLVKKFNRMNNAYFQDRAVDILDIGRKVLQKLLSQKTVSLVDLEKDAVIVCSDLTVSDTASMNKKHVLGFVTEFGGRTSHSAILARAIGIPAVLGVNEIPHKANTGDIIIIDGIDGKVFVNPDENTIALYDNKIKNFKKKEAEYTDLVEKKAITIDNKEIPLKANMEIPEQEIDSVIVHGAEGVGLYRSEFLYLSKKRKVLPTEDQQFNAYKYILEKFPGTSVTIRTLDLGGDKVLQGVTEKELNPYMGWRAIRFCLSRVDIFKIQIRALLRASVYGKLKIMFPMITGVEEVEQAKKIIDQVKKDLKKEKKDFSPNIPIGIMIETPAAVLVSDVLAKHCDFFSIGTNDLIQYTLACDRTNEKVAYLFEPLHPSVLKMIKTTVDNAHKEKIEVSVCGEMATEFRNALVLVGLGVDSLSMGPISIPWIKKMIRSIKYSEAETLANELLLCKGHSEIITKIDKWVRKKIPFIEDYSHK